MNTINHLLKHHGVYNSKTVHWTDDEVEKLKALFNQYPFDYDKIWLEMPHRSRDAICMKVHKLGLHNIKTWEPEAAGSANSD